MRYKQVDYLSEKMRVASRHSKLLSLKPTILSIFKSKIKRNFPFQKQHVHDRL